MAGKTGKNAYIAFNGTVLDTDYQDFSASESGDVVDDSGGADANRTYLTTLKDGTASITIKLQAEDTATWGAVAVHEEGTLEWGDEGTAAGKPRSYVNAIVIGRERTMTFDDSIAADIEWQMSGAVTDTTY